MPNIPFDPFVHQLAVPDVPRWQINPFPPVRVLGWDELLVKNPNPLLLLPTTEVFDKILAALAEVFEVEGVIAGGSVRDLTLGLLCKDIDVFLPCSVEQWMEHSEELGWGGEKRLPAPYKDVNKKEIGVGRVSTAFKGFVIDVALMGEGHEPVDVSKFPLGLQQASYNGRVDLTEQFAQDIEGKTCTCFSTEEESVAKYEDKFNEWTKRNNLKDWKFIRPTIKKWWEN